MDNAHNVKSYGVAIPYIVLFALSFGLLFYHLDNRLLWGDEAETAVLAKNVVQFGVPRTYDGTNYIVLHGAVDETPTHVWIWSPWMQNYLAATSFVLFGPTTWAARAPFALICWCSVLLLALVAWKIYRNHWVAVSAAAILAASEIFLLQARNCRYYPISIFGEILFAWGIYELFASRRRGMWLTALALILLFYSNYIMAGANLPAILCAGIMLRKQGWPAVLRLAAAFGIFMAAILPWLLYAHPWAQSHALGGENYLSKALVYLLEIHSLFIPLCIFLLPLIGLFLKDRKPGVPDTIQRWEQFTILLLALYYLAVVFAPGFYTRYQLPLLPLLCLLAAVWLLRYIKWRWLAVALIVVQISSNLFSFITTFPFSHPYRHGATVRFPLVEFVSGMSSPYSDRFTDVLDFFKTHAHRGETVLSFDPEYPMIFYTPLVVIDGQLMIPPPGKLPDWILPSPASGLVARPPVALPDYLKSHYRLITIPVHDSVPGGSMPEPDYYEYKTAKTFVPFFIYQLNEPTNEPARALKSSARPGS
jgi:4-amino-4-deoxy-L-arabinose transferase-like glycosyltransferase